jgi:hypothetical protein
LEETAATADVKARLLSEVSTLLSQVSSFDLWSLFLLLEGVASGLSNDTRILMMRLISEDDGPFLKVHFSSKRQQGALNELLKISGVADVESFPTAIAHLSEVWPFQILGVKPPYSSRSYGYEASESALS